MTDAKQEAFYLNELEKYNTKWVQCRRVVIHGEFSAEDLEIFNLIPFFFNGVYCFILKIEKILYLYDLYSITPEEIRQSTITRTIPGLELTLLPREKSEYYLVKTLRILSQYKEELNTLTMDHLEFEFSRNAMIVEPWSQLTPLLLWKLMQDKIPEEKHALLTLSYPGGFREAGDISGKVVVEPVYGPSHNPLTIRFTDGEYLRIVFNLSARSVEPKGENNMYFSIRQYEGQYTALQWILIDIVREISQLENINVNYVRNAIRSRFFFRPTSALDGKMMRKWSDERFGTIRKDVLQAVRLEQLVSPITPSAEGANKLLEWVEGEYSGMKLSGDMILLESVKTLTNMIEDWKKIQ